MFPDALHICTEGIVIPFSKQREGVQRQAPVRDIREMRCGWMEEMILQIFMFAVAGRM
jgi:hypothetical protein